MSVKLLLQSSSYRIRTFTTIRQRSLHGSSIKRQQQRNTFGKKERKKVFNDLML